MTISSWDAARADDLIDEMKRMGYRSKKAQLQLLAMVLYVLSGGKNEEND